VASRHRGPSNKELADAAAALRYEVVEVDKAERDEVWPLPWYSVVSLANRQVGSARLLTVTGKDRCPAGKVWFRERERGDVRTVLYQQGA
jgi:hypothetical protein